MENKNKQIINILLPNGKKLKFDIDNNLTVGNLIKQIELDSNVIIPQGRQISIIYGGKILENNQILSKIEKMEEFSVHVFYRPLPGNPLITEEIHEIKGFDRLLRMNYSREQIEEFRHSFHLLHNSLSEPNNIQVDLEEEWFPVIFNQENPLEALNLPPSPPRNEENDNYDEDQPPWINFLLGLILGLIFGISSVIFMVISLHNKWLVFGLIAGTTLSLTLSHYLGFSII